MFEEDKKDKNDNKKYPVNQQIQRIYGIINELIIDYGYYYVFGENKTAESIVLYFLSLLMEQDEVFSYYKYFYKKEMSSRRWVSIHSKLEKNQNKYYSLKLTWQKIQNNSEMYEILREKLDKLEMIFKTKLNREEIRKLQRINVLTKNYV